MFFCHLDCNAISLKNLNQLQDANAQFLVKVYKVFKGTGTSCKEKFRKENFQLDSCSPGACFFLWNHQLIKLEEHKIL